MGELGIGTQAQDSLRIFVSLQNKKSNEWTAPVRRRCAPKTEVQKIYCACKAGQLATNRKPTEVDFLLVGLDLFFIKNNNGSFASFC